MLLYTFSHEKKEEKRVEKKGPLCKGICKCTQCSCRRRRDGFGFGLPCVRGGGPRSGGRVVTIPHRLRRSSLYTRDLQVCLACLQASPRGVRKPRSGWRVVKEQSLTAFGGAPFTQRSLKLCTNFPITEVSFAYFSFQRKVRCLLFFSKEKQVILLFV